MHFRSVSHVLWSVLTATVFIVAACVVPNSEPAADDRNAPLTVVATYSILGDWVANVGGEHVNIITLVGPGGDAHTFEPTPADSVALTQAALIFENGLEFESWLDDLYTASGSTAERVAVAEGLSLLAMSKADHDDEAHEDAHADHAEEGDEHDRHHGEFDPHVWHDVTNAMMMVEAIRDALSAADPENGATYAANAEDYLAELAELDAWIREQVVTLPVERRKLVTSHDTFGYFAAAYGFEIVGTALGISTEAADPSAQRLAELIELIEAEAVPALFAENVANPQLIEQIARETGVVVGPPLYTDALGAADSGGDSYIKMMRYNVDAIVTTLSK